MTSSIPFTYSLDGRSINVLGLSAETEEKLHRLEISTLEQLARLAVNRLGWREREAIDAIRIELATRLAPHTVWCFSTSGFAAHFIIRADDLFFFKASCIPDDQEIWTCTYQWQVVIEDVASYDELELFRNPLTTAESHTTVLDCEADDTGEGGGTSDLHDFLEEHHGQLAIPNTETDSSDNDEVFTLRERPILLSNPLPALLETILAPLSPRERWVLELRYGLHDGTPRTLDLVGDALNCTRARIGQIEQKAFKKIRAATSEMLHIRHALATLESSLDQSNGVLPITVAAQKLGLVTETFDPHNPINEAHVRFLLSFGLAIDIPRVFHWWRSSSVGMQRCSTRCLASLQRSNASCGKRHDRLPPKPSSPSLRPIRGRKRW
ncbi:MAG: hypothetical protein HC914_20300 [Chloroflexaceae bacterium]|nr:hypothetical protein [Chloroflexaceae bacterium]